MKPPPRRLFVPLLVASALVLLSFGAEEKPEGDSEAPAWKAGDASVVITPEEPLPMSGYASRKDRPSEGTEQDLYAKALALEDESGGRVVFVTFDLIGIRSVFRDDVEQAVGEKFGLAPEALVMNASHTHCGPNYTHETASNYYEKLVADTVGVVGDALDSLAPALVYSSRARCGFAMNRRTPTEQGFRNHPNPDGLVDHTVPVLSVRNPDGDLRTVLFGYACHNTTMGFMKWFGDYAGYAQEYLEAEHEGLTAMFLNGCSGDQNPYPRRMLYFAQRHGRSLATAVEAAVEESQSRLLHQRELPGPLHLAMEDVTLPFTEESGRGAYGDYPVQLVGFGDALTMVHMGGEVTIDYSLRLKKELGMKSHEAWVSGYSNDYNGYVPSRRVLLEGGYEAESRPWDPGIEEILVEKVHGMFGRLRKG